MIPSAEVYVSKAGCSAPAECDMHIGTCRFNLRRGAVSTSFSYSSAYLESPNAFAIDPALPLRSTSAHCDGLPGALRDSAPDRWGRHLIDRRALVEASEQHCRPRTLDEVDYLLGVYDASRQGALRFALPESREFLSPRETIPPLIELKRLIAASNHVSRSDEGKEQVKELLDAGSGSLGGARPKASVVDEGKLLLAKFSHPGDAWDVMAWEKTSLDIARLAGIVVPNSRLVRLGKSSALLLERFDREGSLVGGERVPYLSAMSLVGAADGSQNDYVDVAEALVDWCENPNVELEELFKRVALSIALHNTDDHLRNLGFVRLGGRWQVSPVFDVNINPDSVRQRATAVYGEAGDGEASGLKELAVVCGLGRATTADAVASVVSAARQWSACARRNGCKESEMAVMGRVIEERCDALDAAFA